MKKYQRKQYLKYIIVRSVIILGFIFICRTGLIVIKQEETSLFDNMFFYLYTKEADISHGWNLILVNREYRIPNDFHIEFTELSNGEKVDSRIYPELQDLFDAARNSGLELFVREGYRTQEEQQEIMENQIREYTEQGYSKREAKELAEKYVAVPGTSEHQLGLSVDINADTMKNSSEIVYKWLDTNAHEYGFIKRYPSEKVEITGINNEPWHYRYVGKEVAREMKNRELCLEEYLDQMEK